MVVAQMKDIVKRYKSQLVLDNVSLDLVSGEIVGLLGPNGAGKTTLIHALAGLIGVDSGDIQMFGKTLRSNPKEIKQQIGLVTQAITIFEDLTAKENLEFFGGVYGLKGIELRKRIQETLEFVGLTEHAKKLPTTFSGGMNRRLNIACSLMHKPRLLIMDEPTVGIDPQSRNHILEQVKELNRQGTTVLYTTHYMEEVQKIASRVVILDQGRIIAQGSVADLVESIQHEERIVLEVSKVVPDLLDRLQGLEGVKKVQQEGNTIHIISLSGSGNLNRVLSLAKEAGGVLSINAEKPNLEDVFLTLTGRALRDGETK